MEIKKCVRCGQFFETNQEVCNSCLAKDNKEIGRLKNYFSYNYIAGGTSKEDISFNTGITIKNLNRFLNTEEFANIFVPETLNGINVDENNTVTKV